LATQKENSMDALKRLSLALAVALVGSACGGDDDGKTTPPTGNIDAGVDSGVTVKDSGTDAGKRPCTSYTPVMDGKCGGSHCTQTEAEVKASAVANATCGGDVEIKSFCSLQVVDVVSM
jgi:hypothetical protein